MAPIKTTYESKAQVRDLRKEATQKFVPGVVKRKIDAVRGRGGLIEEEELEKLEAEGYGYCGSGQEGAGGSRGTDVPTEEGRVDIRKDGGKEVGMDEETLRRLKEEEAAFEREIAEAGDGGEDPMEVEGAEERRLQPTVEEASDEDG